MTTTRGSTGPDPERYVLDLGEIDRTMVDVVGGKGAALGELTHLEAIRVPPGFCVTTSAYERAVGAVIGERVARLAALPAYDAEAQEVLSAEIRRIVEAVDIPAEVEAAVRDALAALGGGRWAVRSSATAEDLPSASFAGQHDSYLDVVGVDAVLRHLRSCWASLFTARAVAYRAAHGIGQARVQMAVVVQRMVDAEVAGVLFTADPVTSNRRFSIVESAPGLGDAVVSGTAETDVHRLRDGVVVGVERTPRRPPALSEPDVIRLEQLGRRIESHLGVPQDIEWCLAGGELHIVQSRPITSLFPIPEADDDRTHVYISVGHQQMMTDAMRPLGLSVWQMTALRPMVTAGGRLFVDVTDALAQPVARQALLQMMGRSDPLLHNALEALVDRGDVVPQPSEPGPPSSAPPVASDPIATDPNVVVELISRSEASVAELRRAISTVSGGVLFDVIRADIVELKRLLLDPQSTQAVMAAFEATWWLDEHLEQWLGEKNVASTLSQSVPHNVTSEMGRALLDVADVVRAHPAVVEHLRSAPGDDVLAGLAELPGGSDARDAIDEFLDRYGMRCVGEIDITRPRWSERPSVLVPVILGNVANCAHGATSRGWEAGRQDAMDKQRDVLRRLRALPDGERKADETERMITRLRTFVGYREHPKYGMVSRYAIYKEALLREADRLVTDGVVDQRDDVFYLSFDEFERVVRTSRADRELITRRRAEFRSFQAMTPPRVLTSDGETLDGEYQRDDVPPGALVGTPVSAGVVEGRARLVTDMVDADIDAGDILVTTHTDPSWSPLFVRIGGLVTEVGGLMTHGAVVAREYGLVAVVGVAHAMERIRDGQWIRVDGTDGHVEILADAGDGTVVGDDRR